MRFAALLLGISLTCTGCAKVTEGDRNIIEQDYHAGNFVLKNAQNDAVKQAGIDIALNSRVLMENLGPPLKEAGKYSPILSKQYREKSKKEHAALPKILNFLSGLATASNIPWATAIISTLTAGFALVKKYAHGKKLRAVYSGTQNVINDFKELDIEEFKDKDGNINMEAISGKIVDTMRTASIAHNVYESIKKDVNHLRGKGILKSS